MKLLTACLIGLVLSGCSTTRWDRPDTDQRQFLRDRYDCIKKAQIERVGYSYNAFGGSGSAALETSKVLFTSCMTAMGYLPNRDGALEVPEGMAVRMR